MWFSSLSPPFSLSLFPFSSSLLFLLLHTYSLLVYSSLVAELTRLRHGFLPYVIFALKTLHSAADVPKKVEKTSSENTTFENSEHPYRTCGSPGGLFLFRFLPSTPEAVPPLWHFRSENLHSAADVPKKVEKTSSENTTFEISEHPYRTCGSSGYVFFLFGSSPMSVFPWKTSDFLNILVQIFDFLVTIALASLPSVFSSSLVPPLCQFSFGKPMIFSTFSFKSWMFL